MWFQILLILFPVMTMSFVYAEPIPNYYKPYAPIYTDKQVYSWTDKIHITIVAPSWNENKYAIDSIGDERGHSVKISTPGHFLEPYKLTETSQNSGIFAGEVTLTGFSHDTNGDGVPDTNPQTTGSGPTNGLLAANRDDGITISFEFADGVVLTKSAKIRWNLAEIYFSDTSYLPAEPVTIQLKDPDANLNPESPDTITIDVSSDSDSAGISVVATETNDDSGIFEAMVFLTQSDKSSGNRLYAIPDDIVYATYQDRTLPLPHSISDVMDITAKSVIESNIPDVQKVSVSDIRITDSSGKLITEIKTNQQIQIISNIRNNQNFVQAFTYIIQISDSSGSIVSLSWIVGQMAESQNLDLSQSWMPLKSDNYKIETFVWRSLNDARTLAQSHTESVHVE
jgi:hypothetical protein